MECAVTTPRCGPSQIFTLIEALSTSPIAKRRVKALECSAQKMVPRSGLVSLAWRSRNDPTLYLFLRNYVTLKPF